MTIKKAILTQNDGYKQGKTITPLGIVLHSVGCPQPSAEVFFRKWNKPKVYVNAHAMIDGNTGEVWQYLPWNVRGWHVAGSANDTHIGVETGEPACIKYTTGCNFTVPADKLEEARDVARRTYKAAVELFADLCTAYGLDPQGRQVIISHAEAGRAGLGSKHADPEHLWQGLGLPFTMDSFRRDVKAAMEPDTDVIYRVQVGAFHKRQYAELMVKQLKAAGFDAFIREDRE